MDVASASEAVDRRRRQNGAWKDGRRPKVPVHTFCRRRKSTAEPLGRSPGSEGANRTRADSLAASPSPADGPSGYSKRRAFTHSGGTAPDLHRTSPLCPRGHPRQAGMLAQRVGLRSDHQSAGRHDRQGTVESCPRVSRRTSYGQEHTDGARFSGSYGRGVPAASRGTVPHSLAHRERHRGGAHRGPPARRRQLIHGASPATGAILPVVPNRAHRAATPAYLPGRARRDRSCTTSSWCRSVRMPRACCTRRSLRDPGPAKAGHDVRQHDDHRRARRDRLGTQPGNRKTEGLERLEATMTRDPEPIFVSQQAPVSSQS